MPGTDHHGSVTSPLHPVILAGLVDSFDEPRLVDRRPPHRARSLRVRWRRLAYRADDVTYRLT
jgi:hypothetical protein